MPAKVTVIDEVVAPVFQLNVPDALVLKVELPQLSTTFTTGVETDPGAAVPEPAGLVQPLTVAVTE